MFISVALPIPRITAYTYSVAATQAVQVGCRVIVPLGKRVITGTVIAVDVAAVEDVRQVVEVLDDTPSFPPQLVEFCDRLAQYYMCSQGEVFAAALPSGLSATEIIRVRMAQDVSLQDIELMKKRAPRRAALLEIIRNHDSDVTVSFLQRSLKNTAIADQLDALHRAGVIEISREIEGDVGGKTVRAVRISEPLVASESDIQEAFATLDVRAPKQSLALGLLYLAHERGEPTITVNSLTKELGCSASVIEGLVDKGLAQFEDIYATQASTHAYKSLVQRAETELEPTAEQQHAIDTIAKMYAEKRFSCTLIDGVTGSGKTIVYQRVMQQVASAGQQVILLVPEISLTPQLFDRFTAYFGDSVVLIHSKMSMGERISAWRRAGNGEAGIIIGPRSAILTPTKNLGLIIVDEEHEPSYKQTDPAPRYHGRDAALIRAQVEGCPVVLGSATPSLESWYNVQQKRYSKLDLRTRADGAVLPTIKIVDTLQEQKSGQMNGSFSTQLLREIVAAIQNNHGVLLFMNKRGYSSRIQCADCADIPSCKNCDVTLTYHKATRSLRCHYCGFSTPAYSSCTVCGGVDMQEIGSGTQKLEEELQEFIQNTNLFSRPVVIERMDADSTSKKGSFRKLLDRFSKGDVDVLVGTQMIAKGLDISRVTLVAVVNADQSLFQSDFRASERTVQLLVQVAGRAGRTAGLPGTVFIQTSQPSHPAIQAVLQPSLSEWRSEELTVRKESNYPPYTRFITLTVSGARFDVVDHTANVLVALIEQHTDFYERLPSADPPIPRIRNKYRKVIVIKNNKHVDPSGSKCRAVINATLLTYYAKYSSAAVRVTVDIDALGSL